MTPGLNERHTSTAYHAGRFLAICQHIQDLSNIELNSTYVDRFFGAACTRPLSILPRVFKTAVHRLRKIDDWKLRRDVEASLIQLHQEFGEIWPKQLNSEGQGLFQLGFFHQAAALPRKDWRD